MKLRFFWVSPLLFSALLVAKCQSASNTNNQNVRTNNGTMQQFNVRVTPQVAKALEEATVDSARFERGYLRTIVPADEPTPKLWGCNANPQALTVVLGGAAVVSCARDSHCVVLRDNHREGSESELLWLDRTGNTMSIGAKLFSRDGKIVAVVSNNETHANPSAAFTWERPDPHTVVVTDQYTQTVLDLKFLNPRAIYLEGVFYDAAGLRLKVEKDRLLIGGNTFERNCVSGSGTAFAF